jgi:hypothetical protein
MNYDSQTNYHWAMSDPVLDRPDIERKFGIFTYNKVKNHFTNSKQNKAIFFLQRDDFIKNKENEDFYYM